MDREDWNLRYAGRDLRAEPNQFLVDEAQDLAPGRALDLACGEGRNAVWLAQRGWQVTAVDFSEVGLSRARDLAAGRHVEVDWIPADLHDYEPEGFFDLVLVLYVHLPAEERHPLWRKAAAALAPGGTLLIVGHDRTNLTDGYGGPRNPAVLYSPDDVTGVLSGLAIVRAERVRRAVSSEEGDFEAIDTMVRAMRPPDG